MAIGIAILVWLFFQPKRYQEIYTKTLIFDDSVIKDFREESNRNRKRYVGMIILSVLLFLLGTQLVFMIERVVGNETCNALDWFVDAASVMLLILAGVSIRSENIIAFGPLVLYSLSRLLCSFPSEQMPKSTHLRQ